MNLSLIAIPFFIASNKHNNVSLVRIKLAWPGTKMAGIVPSPHSIPRAGDTK